MNKIYRLFILFLFFSSAGIFAFAGDPSSSINDKSSVDTATNAQVQVPAVPSDTSTANPSTSYLYDLKKLIEKSRENIKEVNEKIKEQAVLKRNQKREERAREYYEKGVELTNEGRLEEAREYFEKAIRITEHPEMAGYIKESQRRLRKQEAALQNQENEHNHQIKEDENARKEDVEEAYKEAVELYKEKKYHPAKDAFEHVDDLAPDYRATDSYLKIIDQDIVIADALAVKQQAVEIQRQQKEAEEARSKEKAMWLAQIEEKEKEHKEAIDKQAAEVYDDAVELYKNKKFAEAKKKFEEVSWVIPDYKKTMWYLGRIDHDAQVEQERVAQEQQKALEEQRWEEEVERKKQEAAREKELEAKQRQHLEDLEEQAQFLYTAAVKLFKDKNMAEALEKFNDIENTYPGFKSTRVYIARIKQWQFDQQEELLESQRQTQEKSIREKELALERQREEELKQRNAQAQEGYDQALDLYRDHQWKESQAQFESVELIVPDFKSTRHYLEKLEVIIANNAAAKPVVVVSSVPASVVVAPTPAAIKSVVAPPVAVVATPVPVVPAPVTVETMPVMLPQQVTSMPAQVKMDVSLEDQQKQTQEIASLAERSAELYREIADIADDSTTVRAKRKMAQVDDVLNGLKESQGRLLRHMQEEEWRREQEASRAKEEERRAQVEKMYQEGVEYLRSHEYAKAKINFLALETIIPDYKATHRYLSRIDEYQKRAGVEAVTNYEKTQAKLLEQLQNKQNTEELRRIQQEQEKEHDIELQQQSSLQTLAQKASDINDDIIQLARSQDLEAMKAKFIELENTVSSLITLKEEMAKQKGLVEREKQLAHESVEHRNEVIREEQQEENQIHGLGIEQLPAVNHPVLSIQPSGADQYKHREIMQEQNAIFSEGVDRFEHKKYSEAKLLFGELADQNDRRAEAWLKKVDRAITRELLKSEAGEERERTAFIEEQLKAQRELIIIQERERQRQKKLTEELERQKHLYEDDRLLQLRHEETMKAQERERERQEAKRLQLEKENEKQQESLRFHKIIPANNSTAATPSAVPAAAPALTPKQVQAQIDFSNERKDFLDAKYKKEQEEKSRQERIEERQKERAQREADRQARLKAKAEKLAQEKEHREELLHQQQLQRAEKIKQDDIMREEAKRQKELEKEEQQRQADLEARREAVRKELEEGVEGMYQEALSLYKQGDYTAASDKFKDVQDIIPGYKHAQEYMDEARQKSLVAPPVINPDTNGGINSDSETSPDSSSPVSHQDSVSKALDLFDSNVK